MTRPRKFSLINGTADELMLSDHRASGIAVINPKGLGIGFTNTLEDFNTNQIVKNKRVKLPDFEIDLLLGLNWSNATPRQLYMQIIKFLNNPPYTLKYVTENGEFKKDVELLDLPMSDIKESQTIQETVKFSQLSLWYQETTFKGKDPEQPRTDKDGKILRDGAKLAATDPQKLGRAYNINPGDGYVYSSNIGANGTGGVFDLHNDSIYFGLQSESPLEIIIKGPATGAYKSPFWEIVGPDGKVISTDAYNLDVVAGQQLIIRGGFGKNRARIQDIATGIDIDAYQKQDHSKTNFINVPLGDSQLRFHTSDNRGYAAGDILITMRKEYMAVG